MESEKRCTYLKKKLPALLLAVALALTAILPGRVMATEEGQSPGTEPPQILSTEPETEPTETEPPETQPPETEPTETEPTETEPAETEPPETQPPETEPPETQLPETQPTVTEPSETESTETETEETQPTETQPSWFERLIAELELLAEEAVTLAKEQQPSFLKRLRELWNFAYDLYDGDLLSGEELEEIDRRAEAILQLLEEAPQTEADAPTTLEAQRFGSRETPMAATAQNSVASLGNSSGIKFRIFNYTNGMDGDGNYIKSGGVNDNGLSGYFDFRGTSYENTGPDGKAVSNVTNPVTDVDGYTANHATVLHTLNSAGYPVFDGSRDNGPQKSLGYLFGAGGKGVTSYTAANTPLRKDSRGQYYYNSADNAVDFDTASSRFIVRTYRERGQTTAGTGSGQYYDFFPFTYWDGSTRFDEGSAKWYNYNNTLEVDYWYGMTMEATFSMPESGIVKITDGSGSVTYRDNMVFEFSGDDDVWVFIDDVLVLDLGGTHGVVSGSIDFATGKVQQYLDWNGTTSASAGTSFPTTLETRFAEAGREPNGGWAAGTDGRIFADYTEHTIKFFYLERATSCANCKISFNMPILPTGELTVEKQVEGTQTEKTEQVSYAFALTERISGGERKAAGIGYDLLDAATGIALGTGTTDSNGGFALKAGQKAVFNLTAGKTYRVRETDAGLYAESVRCSVNGVQQDDSACTGDITVDPNAPAAVEFTNRLSITYLTLRKKVSGNLGDRDQKFAFSVRLYASGQEIPFPAPEAGENYTLKEGAAVFSLRHDETVTLDDIPVGAGVVVTELLADGYVTRWQMGQQQGDGVRAEVDALTQPVEILFINTREVTVETGVFLEEGPYLLMLTGAALGLWLMLRRRRKYEG